MGFLKRCQASAEERTDEVRLQGEHVVGRSSDCDLVIPVSFVSGQHASLRWTPTGWTLRDLGSRNGTYVNDIRVAIGDDRALTSGDRVAFGHVDEAWEFSDAAPSRFAVSRVDSGQPVGRARFEIDGLLALPNPEDPHVTIFVGAGDHILIEGNDFAARPVIDREEFEVDGLHYQVTIAQLPAPTREGPPDTPLSSGRVRLRLTHLEGHPRTEVLKAIFCDDRRDVTMPPRVHLALLVLLALARDADHDTDERQGWRYTDELARDLGITRQHLNQQVFRLRKDFGALGFAAGIQVVERRPSSDQLRLARDIHRLEFVGETP